MIKLLISINDDYKNDIINILNSLEGIEEIEEINDNEPLGVSGAVVGPPIPAIMGKRYDRPIFHATDD